jgi:hypothetical protein
MRLKSPALFSATCALFCCFGLPVLADAQAPASAQPSPQTALESALTDGSFYGQERFRYEDVKQNGFTKDASATTLRSILGYKTGDWQDMQVDLALLNVAQFGNQDFNDGSDNRTAYPAIGDPGDTQLFHASLTYKGLPQTTFIGGRQEVALDNQRWVGAPVWRQIVQTFDGVTVKNTSLDNMELYYSYLFHQNRSPGTEVTNGQYDMSTNLLHVAYTGLPGLRLVGYSYLTDIATIHSLSNATTGFRIEAKEPVAGTLWVTGNGEYAFQNNYGYNPHDYALSYYLLEPGIAYQTLSALLGYEVLQSDGVDAVQSPMMAPHSMNGWADQFTTTPLMGLHDSYVHSTYTFKLPVDGFGEAKIEGFFHIYNADRTGAHYGNEYDVDFTQKLGGHYAIGTQVADYKADKLLKDARKIVLTLQLDY